MKISIIAAIGKNNEIGLDNKLLWTSKSELEHFKKLTLGKPIIMGRKTFESLPGILPGRPHFVMSQIGFEDTDEVTYLDCDIEDVLAHLETNEWEEVVIVGGASIYEQALPLADELHISHMDWTGEADAFFPKIGSEWKRYNAPYSGQIEEHSPKWEYVKYIRNR